MAVKGNGEIDFATEQEELDYRLRHEPINTKKLACARISRAIEDLFDPPLSVQEFERVEALRFLTSNTQYWKETRDFWCDLTEEYNGDKLREKMIKQYETFDNKIVEDRLPEPQRIELQKSLPEYDIVCEELKKDYWVWVMDKTKIKKEYDERFSHSLLPIPFVYRHTDSINNLMSLKREYEEFFESLGVGYKRNPIEIKINNIISDIDTLYAKEA